MCKQENNFQERLLFWLKCIALCLVLSFVIFFILWKFVFKEPKEIDIPTIKIPQTVTFWGAKYNKLLFIVKPYSNSQKATAFNDKILNESLGNTKYTFWWLYVCNFSNSVVERVVEDQIIKVVTKKQSFGNTVLKSLPDGSHYIESFSRNNLDNLDENHIEKFILPFDSSLTIKDAQAVYLTWNKQKIVMKKVQCLRKDFYEFVEQPKMDFFVIASD